MAKVILICGKLCCGKTAYARRFRRETGAVLLSVDEIMLALFGTDAGERHDEYAGRVQRYLLEKSLELVAAGADAVLDWGFWTRESRERARAFYAEHGVACELHYLHVGDEVWRERIESRNRTVAAGETAAYVVDDGLAAKFAGLFQEPGQEEVDLWVTN